MCVEDDRAEVWEHGRARIGASVFCKVPFWSVQRGRESALRMDVDQSCCCGSSVEQPSRIKAIPMYTDL